MSRLTAKYNVCLTSVSIHTAQWTQLGMGLLNKRPTHIPLFTKRYCQLHLQWAQQHRKWIMDSWKGVTWLDEL
ncbi:HTH_Tnp_Tc3_2 domain-containing protein [Trichonephila clavipes]|nr:HTH_Tnp_Tc3_2 domain-containing protein [Trichonephila clavipes]